MERHRKETVRDVADAVKNNIDKNGRGIMYLTVLRHTAAEPGTGERYAMKSGESILQVLVRNHLVLEAPCGGNGTCGKCTIQLVSGKLSVTEADTRTLTREQLESGLRLACRAYPEADITVRIREQAEFKVLMSGEQSGNEQEHAAEESEYGIAIDIGTTTIAMELIELHSGRTVKSIGELNQQRSFGADVVSRIAASNEGNAKRLTEMIRGQLSAMIKRLEPASLNTIIIAANTTMCHILMGYPCESLGLYPYTPVNIKTIYTDSYSLFGKDIPACEVIILPGISTYVGADIISGIVQCGITDTEHISAFVDLGTNGEMALGNQERILVTSAAAGPAFEGGNISCGTGSIPGAISSVEIKYKMARVKTIQNKTPVGLCGSGVVELTAELLRNGLIDETGAMSEEYIEAGYPVTRSIDGNVVMIQKDVREIQMAKSAVYSALVLLVKRYGISMDEVDKVYLAGGFGFYLNIEKAVAIGLLPRQWKDKIIVAGNTSLLGAKSALVDKWFIEKAEAAVEVASELSLAMDQEFNELYTENMFFV